MKLRKLNLVIILLISVFTLEKNPIKVNADYSVYDDVGIYFEVEEVSVPTKVCFTSTLALDCSEVVHYVQESGRNVYSSNTNDADIDLILSDPYPHLPPILPPVLTDPLSGEEINGLRPIRFYFYDASASSPKITNISILQNDIDSVIEVLDFMECQVSKYDNNLSRSGKNNAILGAIRAIHNEYKGKIFNVLDPSTYIDAYEIVCGPIDWDFVSYVNNDYSRHIRSIDYFSYFISNSEFNLLTETNTHGYTINSNYCTNTQHFLIDPFSDNVIDLVHMFAAIDGNLPSTGRSVAWSMYSTDFDYTVSFMGDIQTEIVDIEKKNRNQFNLGITPESPGYIDYYNLSSFSTFMNQPSSYCPISDMLADIDGYSIGKSYIGNLSLADGLDNYYYVTVNRLLTFRIIVIQQQKGMNADITLSNFKECVEHSFGIEYDTNSLTYQYYSMYSNPILEQSFIYKYLYVLQGDLNFFTQITSDNLVDLDILVEILELFSDYIFQL